METTLEEEKPQSWGSHYQAHLNKQKSLANLTNILDGHNKQRWSSPMKTTKAFHGSIFRAESWSSRDNIFGSSSTTSLLASSVESLSLTNMVERDRCYIKELRIKGINLFHIQRILWLWSCELFLTIPSNYYYSIETVFRNKTELIVYGVSGEKNDKRFE